MDRGLWTCLLPYCTPSTAWEWRTAILQPGLNGQWLLLQPNVINAQKITLLGGRLQQRWWRTSAAKGQTALAVADLDGCRSGSAPPPWWRTDAVRQGRFYDRAGAVAPKTLFDEFKASAYRCEKEGFLAFKIRQNAFLARALPRTPHNAPQTL